MAADAKVMRHYPMMTTHAFFVTRAETTRGGQPTARIIEGVLSSTRDEALRAWLQSINYGRPV